MLLPIGTDRPRRRPTLVTYWLVASNLAVFVAQVLWTRSDAQASEQLARALWLFPGEGFRAWQLLTYQFLHGDWIHLLGNMLVLYVFGMAVEDRLGRVGFAAFYLGAGVIAGAAHIVIEAAPVIGASGAIAGVTGAFLVMFPRTSVRVLLFFFVIGVFEIPAWWFIAFAIAKDFVFAGLPGGGVAYFAHLGGYAFGIGVSLALLWWRVIPREPYDLFSIGRQAQRRRRFKEMVSHGDKPWRSDAAEKGKVREPERSEVERQLLAEERAKISSMLERGDVSSAADAYLAMLERDSGAVLPRDQMIVIGNHLYASGRRAKAAEVYDVFLKRFPRDPERFDIKLMLALISVRELNDPVRAERLLEELESAPLDAEHRALAERLAAELG